MKKLVTTMALCTALATGAFAADILFDTYSLPAHVYKADGTLATTVQDGYIITYWHSDTGDASGLKPIGVGTFGDATYFEYLDTELDDDIGGIRGGFEWQSQYLDPLTLSGGQTGYLAVRIFQVSDLLGYTSDEWLEYCDLLSQDVAGDPTAVADLWQDAYDLWLSGMGGDIVSWEASYVAGSSGEINGVLLAEIFGWIDNGKYYLESHIIPEPAQLAALLGIFALLAAARRRK